MIAVALGMILPGAFHLELNELLLISLSLTALTYFPGDLFIFRMIGDQSDPDKRNVITTAFDAVLAFLIIWIMGEILFSHDDGLITVSLICAVIISVCEWIFHKYLDYYVFDQKQHRNATH
ncbi:hypothetical protein CUU64_13600 [Bacillus sp. V5-8f]|nr:hypothetical protein CUU64_13600 [Bacillus sp. V5-8f]